MLDRRVSWFNIRARCLSLDATRKRKVPPCGPQPKSIYAFTPMDPVRKSRCESRSPLPLTVEHNSAATFRHVTHAVSGPVQHHITPFKSGNYRVDRKLWKLACSSVLRSHSQFPVGLIPFWLWYVAHGPVLRGRWQFRLPFAASSREASAD